MKIHYSQLQMHFNFSIYVVVDVDNQNIALKDFLIETLTKHQHRKYDTHQHRYNLYFPNQHMKTSTLHRSHFKTPWTSLTTIHRVSKKMMTRFYMASCFPLFYAVWIIFVIESYMVKLCVMNTTPLHLSAQPIYVYVETVTRLTPYQAIG